MNETEIRQLLSIQRTYFLSGATLPVNVRLNALCRLKKSILRHEALIHEALKRDLGKSSFESYMCETGLVLSELSHMLRHTVAYARERTVWTPLAQFASRSHVKPSPYGVVLVMSPWNYPFLLSLDPLIDAIAAGNTVILKPSAYAPCTSRVLETIIRESFPRAHAAVVTGGRAENRCLLDQKFDSIFFTGSKAVGREVLTKAAKFLTPVTLELGGKSPCIVDRTADLKLAARRIVFGKFLNCGQTCVAPDYIYCDKEIREELVALLQKEIRRQFSARPLENPDYGKIVNEKHFRRLLGLIRPDSAENAEERQKSRRSGRIVCGGEYDADALRIAPTVMDQVSFEDPVMQEEIFGPILPVLTYDSVRDAIARINAMPHPLALYIFTSDQRTARRFLAHCSFGGGCVNDVVIHLATSEMGFGGVGESGMGAYHGKKGFDTFTHEKSIVDKKTWIDLPMRYQPYQKLWEKTLRRFLK